MKKCSRIDCELDAVCAVGIALYPPAALMRHYNTDQPLSRMIMSLTVCEDHFNATSVDDLLPPGMLQSMADVCRKTTGVNVDVDASKVVRIEFDDADYLLLLKQQQSKLDS